jgi:hypothetical protein
MCYCNIELVTLADPMGRSQGATAYVGVYIALIEIEHSHILRFPILATIRMAGTIDHIPRAPKVSWIYSVTGS